MSKAVLVIDMPETCVDCQFCCEFDEGIEACCSITDDDKDKSFMKEIDCEDGYCQGRPDWCPLKPLPDRKEITEKYRWEDRLPSFKCGWNWCLDEITGDKK